MPSRAVLPYSRQTVHFPLWVLREFGNYFVPKLGWKYQLSETLLQRKTESQLADHTEIETMLEYFEYDEGRI